MTKLFYWLNWCIYFVFLFTFCIYFIFKHLHFFIYLPFLLTFIYLFVALLKPSNWRYTNKSICYMLFVFIKYLIYLSFTPSNTTPTSINLRNNHLEVEEWSEVDHGLNRELKHESFCQYGCTVEKVFHLGWRTAQTRHQTLLTVVVEHALDARQESGGRVWDW